MQKKLSNYTYSKVVSIHSRVSKSILKEIENNIIKNNMYKRGQVENSYISLLRYNKINHKIIQTFKLSMETKSELLMTSNGEVSYLQIQMEYLKK